MRIAFYADHPYWSQLSNNGGSRTILKSAQVLRELGHKVDVIAHQNKFTWFKHEKPRKNVHPKTDAVVAVTIWDIEHMQGHIPPKAVQAVWVRGWPKWTMPSKDIYKKLRKFKGRIICNSGWLVDHLKKADIKSKLCYAGLEIDFWMKNGRPSYGEHIISIGCLYNRTHKTKQWKWFKELHALEPDYRYVAYGTHKPDVSWLHRFLLRPTQEQLRLFYEDCDIWFTPSKLEGFHCVPAEAALAGCLCFCLDRPSGGTGDWANNETCHMFSSPQDAAEQLKQPDFAKCEKARQVIIDKIGNREKNMKRLVELLK